MSLYGICLSLRNDFYHWFCLNMCVCVSTYYPHTCNLWSMYIYASCVDKDMSPDLAHTWTRTLTQVLVVCICAETLPPGCGFVVSHSWHCLWSLYCFRADAVQFILLPEINITKPALSCCFYDTFIPYFHSYYLSVCMNHNLYRWSVVGSD